MRKEINTSKITNNISIRIPSRLKNIGVLTLRSTEWISSLIPCRLSDDFVIMWSEKYIEDITRGRLDMNFIFSWQKTIFYSLAALVRKIFFCHSKIKFISWSPRVISSFKSLLKLTTSLIRPHFEVPEKTSFNLNILLPVFNILYKRSTVRFFSAQKCRLGKANHLEQQSFTL